MPSNTKYIFLDFYTRYYCCRSQISSSSSSSNGSEAASQSIYIAKWNVRENVFAKQMNRVHKRKEASASHICVITVLHRWDVLNNAVICFSFRLLLPYISYIQHTIQKHTHTFSRHCTVCESLASWLSYILYFWSENVAISKFFHFMHTLFSPVRRTWKKKEEVECERKRERQLVRGVEWKIGWVYFNVAFCPPIRESRFWILEKCFPLLFLRCFLLLVHSIDVEGAS